FINARVEKEVYFQSKWSKGIERTWVGPEYWANRLQDWRVANGRLECIEFSGRKPMRTVHLLTCRLGSKKGMMEMSVQTGLINLGKEVSSDAAAGFLIGAGKGMDYRAASLIHHSYGKGGGLFAGIDTKGCLFVKDFTEKNKYLFRKLNGIGNYKAIKLKLSVKPVNKRYLLDFSCYEPETGKELDKITLSNVNPDRLVGNITLVSHPGTGKNTTGFWFKDWKVSGTKLEEHKDRYCGPVLSTQYTLSKNVMKMTAQILPIGKKDTQIVFLEIKNNDKWNEIASAGIIIPGYTATFKVNNWNFNRDIEYRVVYNMKVKDGSLTPYYYYGTIKHNPVEKETIVLAAFTGNHNLGHGWGGVDRGEFPWTDRIWFPHNDLTEKVKKHKPDILFFSGDQVYEGASPTVAVKFPVEKAFLDYLYKWYLWCWAFRDLTKDIPCITIPDDHDVYQGNLWGAGGRKTDKDVRGGYLMPPEWVNMVQRTQTSHLPDSFDPRPVEQGIGVYYCDLNYGRVSFAVIEDRKFKSGPEGLVPETKSGRADHVIDPDFDPKTADVPGATLLGERQLKFLEEWAADWKNTDVKAVLSQTVFANAATLHGPKLKRLYADYDSNGWPQTGRKKALEKLRKAFAVHISGDQHLATVIHHGIDDWNDAIWSFCVPSIANFYPRAWVPLKPGKNRKKGMPEYTGEFLDGFGNYITVWAAANPGKPSGKKPAALHDRMPGYGIIKFNKKDQTITFECWPRYADPDDPSTGGQYPGWPITINMEDNYGKKAVAYLPLFEVSGLINPVIQIIDESSNEIVYTLRIKGKSFRPKVFKDGKYTIKIGEPDINRIKIIKGVSSMPETKLKTIRVKF
ncbi:twin-arginine translocation pathway signal protein, partial [candidate division KSB1 bacterium]